MKTATLAGARFGRILVIDYSHHMGTHAMWQCVCECGVIKVISGCSLRRGATRSCGCLKKDQMTKHGMKGTAEYRVWCGIIRRCECPSAVNFKDYGGRGIRLAPEWRTSFASFFAAVGPRPTPKHEIDRIDPSKGYEPGNVRWATRKEQARNRRDNTRIEFGGETLSLAEWAERLGVRPAMISNRLADGWSVRHALTTPRGGKRDTASKPLTPEELARKAVRRAIDRGQLVRSPVCQQLGCRRADVHAHHHRGYDAEHRLDVVWLCPKHHFAADPSRDEKRRATRKRKSKLVLR